MTLKSWIKDRLGAFDARMRPWARARALNGVVYEFLLFGLKQAWACLFGASLLMLILAAHLWWPAHAPIARYDFLVVAAVVLQVVFLATRLEYWDEALVILVFHVVGTIMEIFKTAHGSWIYPETNVLRIGGVPLFSGFMYASIGSYIARVTRLFDIRYERYPPLWAPWLLAVASYVNFFTHHYVPDIRVGLFVASAFIFARTWVWFNPDATPRRMPLLLSALLVAVFIWLAENLGTFGGAWVYPSQRRGWEVVGPGKIGAWYLLIILSFVLVTLVRPPKRIAARRSDGFGAPDALYGLIVPPETPPTP
jgi:uncharacterized membrane protein YoaT (DUF817 family)